MNLSENLIFQMNKTIIHRTSTYLTPVIELVKMASEHIKTEIIYIQDNEKIEKYFINSLFQYPQIAMFNFSDLEGNFLMVKRMKEGGIGVKRVIKEGKDPKKSSYNPLIRPWFIGAINTKDIFLTDVYTFFTDKKPGITVSKPIYNKNNIFKGVIAADIYLDTLSIFLKQQQFEDSSYTYILDHNNRIVALPEKNTEIITKQINQIEPLLEKYKGVAGKNFNIKINGKDTIVLVTQFPAQFKKEWKIVFTVPTEVILKEINKSNNHTIIISILILLLSIILTKYLTQVFTKPINHLAFIRIS